VTSSDHVAVAAEAGLTYVNDAVPGITRERREDGWLYRRPDGTPIVDPHERAWIDAIGIPPAWTHVWISPVPDGHILATGRDTRGRKQYRYHPAGARCVTPPSTTGWARSDGRCQASGGASTGTSTARVCPGRRCWAP
jgi:DNA topoisomerase IB